MGSVSIVVGGVGGAVCVCVTLIERASASLYFFPSFSLSFPFLFTLRVSFRTFPLTMHTWLVYLACLTCCLLSAQATIVVVVSNPHLLS